MALLTCFVGLVALGPAWLALARSGVGTLTVDEVKPGMKGYGLSVFRGTRPERFDVEVIDVLRKFRAGQDLILIRTPHPLLNQTQAVAGMSGSPIYVDGKLIGAYAYGWPFGREPIVGVTPIANMLAELSRPVDPEIFRMIGPAPAGFQAPASSQRPRTAARSARSRSDHGGLPSFRSHEPHGALWALQSLADRERGHQGQGPTAEPAQTPIMLSGLTDGAAQLLAEQLQPFGLVPLQAGAAGGGSTSERGAAYVDGGAIGVQLIRGDMAATGVGTVTHVDGQRLIAFGHPMMNIGQTAMPTTTAEIVHVLSSMQRSFKMARPLSPLGTMVHDRQAAIVIDRDMTPATVPVQLDVSEPHAAQSQAIQRKWSFDVASHRALTPVLIFTALVSGLQATLADRSDAIVRAETQLKVAGRPAMRFVDTTYFPGGVSSPLGLSQLRLFSAIDAVYGNPFEHADVTGVEVDLSVRFSDAIAEVMEVRVPYAEVDPGSTIPAFVTLREFDGKERVETVQVHVPQVAAGQRMELEVSAGSAVKPELPLPRNLDDMLEGLKARYPDTSLVLSTKLPSQGLRMRGHLVPHLPGSVLSSLSNQSDSARTVAYNDEARVAVPMKQVLFGSAKIQLEVREEPR